MEFQDWLFDKRVLRRNIRKKLVSRADYQKYLKTLPDMSDNIAEEEEEEQGEVSEKGQLTEEEGASNE